MERPCAPLSEGDYVSATPKATYLQHGNRSISVVELLDLGIVYKKTTIDITWEDRNEWVPDSYHLSRGGRLLDRIAD